MNTQENISIRKHGLALLAAAMLVALPSVASANSVSGNTLELDFGQSVSLLELVDGNLDGIIVGDKLFEDFIYAATNEMPDAEFVNVIAIEDNDGNFGIRFQGAFIDSPDPGGIGDQIASDAHLEFSVHVLDPNRRISDAHLTGAIFVDDDPNRGGSFGSVDEDFLDNDPATDATLRIFKSTFGAGGQNFDDWVLFDARYEWLNVRKDIFAKASHLAIEPVRMTIIDQTFSQEIVPEPTTAMLMFAGSLAMVGLRRRK